MAVIPDSDNSTVRTCWDDCVAMHPATLDVCEGAVKPGTGRIINASGGIACAGCCAAVDEERIQKFNNWTM